MKIKFLHPIASSEWAHPPGKVVEFKDDEMARKFVSSGIAVSAEPVAPEPAARKAKVR
jgi:hypothetical protein